MTLQLATFTGQHVTPLLPDFARLCTVVFRDWPHLYDGDGLYDTDHLQALAASPRSALIVAYDGETPVGASTCLPMMDTAPEYLSPFLARGWPAHRFFYLAESVLLPAYRGQGIGAAFFTLREAHIRAVSTCDFACFYATDRSEHHPLRPATAGSLDIFWRRQGYAPDPGFPCTIRWKEIGNAEESDLAMQVWVKSLNGAALPHEGSIL
jgi:GNAT superfamily N-acetyltransferase